MRRRPIGVSHIVDQLKEAIVIAEQVVEFDQAARTGGLGETPKYPVVNGEGDTEFVTLDLALERAVNLAMHAGQELDDERVRYRDGWRFV